MRFLKRAAPLRHELRDVLTDTWFTCRTERDGMSTHEFFVVTWQRHDDRVDGRKPRGGLITGDFVAAMPDEVLAEDCEDLARALEFSPAWPSRSLLLFYAESCVHGAMDKNCDKCRRIAAKQAEEFERAGVLNPRRAGKSEAMAEAAGIQLRDGCPVRESMEVRYSLDPDGVTVKRTRELPPTSLPEHVLVEVLAPLVDSAPALREYRNEQARRFGVESKLDFQGIAAEFERHAQVPRAHGKLRSRINAPCRPDCVDAPGHRGSCIGPGENVIPAPRPTQHLADPAPGLPGIRAACGSLDGRFIDRAEFGQVRHGRTCLRCMRLVDGRGREQAQMDGTLSPPATRSAPGIDRSGPRVFCQSQYDPDG